MFFGNSEIVKTSLLIFMNAQYHSKFSIIRVRVSVRVRVRVCDIRVKLRQPRVRAKFRLKVLRWHSSLSAKVTKSANLGYSHDRGLS